MSDQPARAAPAEARATAERIVRYREADRAALSTQLHDEAAQTLANVALHLQICDRAISVDVARGRAELAAARDALTAAIARLRYQVYELRPPVLEEAGLTSTLRRYATQLPGADALTIEIVESPAVPHVTGNVTLGLYRIGQAALANAAAHSGASRVKLELERNGEGVVLRVEDNGHGFDLDAALASARASEQPLSGLVVMTDWAAALGAELEIESDSTGTRVIARVPSTTIQAADPEQ